MKIQTWKEFILRPISFIKEYLEEQLKKYIYTGYLELTGRERQGPPKQI